MTEPDEIYLRFKRKLEDLVLVAINSGKRVTCDKYEPGSLCPLGCIPGVHLGRPTGAFARMRLPEADATPQMAPTAFADGFDGNAAYDYIDHFGVRKYYELGQLFAMRFP